MNCSLNEFYKAVGVTKQGTHKMLNNYIKQLEEITLLKPLLYDIRKDHPTLSCRAMYHLINPETMGRDKFEEICKQLGLKIEMSRSKHITTDSRGVIRFDNLLVGFKPNDINQVFSSDITYYQIGESFYYITFVIDCFSRRVLGHSVSKRLSTEQTTIPALKMAIKNRGNMLPRGVIFHSDGGGQYYSKTFLSLTQEYGFKNSMCEFSYENGMVERLNGVVKNNYLKHRKIESFCQLMKEVDRTVELYNNERPHKALNYIPPKTFEKKLLNLSTNNADDDGVMRCKI